jgi:hypothetical protein
MTRKEYEELKWLLAETQAELREGNLSPVLTAALEHCSVAMAGALMSIWVPIDWGRRTIMIVLFLVGLYGVISGPLWLIVAWLAAATMSPRIFGEVSFALGRFRSGDHARFTEPPAQA